MRVDLRCCLFLALSFALVIPRGSSQTGTGPYPFSTFDNRGFDSINLGNLNVHLDIPVFHKAGRGLPFTYDLTYDGLVWQPYSVSGGSTWTPVQNFGWTAQTVIQTGYVSYDKTTYQCSSGAFYTIFDNFVYHDTWGVSHAFTGQLEYDKHDCDLGNLPSFTSGTGDGSGLTLTATESVGVVNRTIITTRNGTSVNAPRSSTDGSTITDTNGNEISVSSSGVYTDTLGVAALTVAGTPPTNVTLTYPNVSGGTASYTIKYSSYNIQTNFGCSGIGEYSASGASLISEIDRADGTKYSFTYEPTPNGSGTVTGRLASITLPTGGTISYAYSGGC
ncbi:hypothetical protein, partial [Edaphobacter sp.]|uniref:hypothetical protein n=1 Tax=Edaphobacter sp. TaxID=1934404 RepID=UPI002DBEE93E